MIRAGLVPFGTYSVEFQTSWKHPYTGKNCYDHRVFHVYEDMAESELADQIANYMTKTADDPRAICHRVKITSISRLDSQ